MKRVLILLALITLILPRAVWAQEDFKLSSISVQTKTGSHRFFTEIAVSPEARERGLMFRQVMPADQAMLFVFAPPQPVQMWMKNTLVPLDMIFVRADGTIAAIAENAVPQSLDIISVREPVAAVIEVAGGTAHQLGIRNGDLVGGPGFPTQN